MLATFIRSIIIYIIVLIVMRLMGKREIGQMQPFELAISIMIADLASIPMTDIGIPISNGIIPILGLLVMHLVISVLNIKSSKIREFICGKPTVLIAVITSPTGAPAVARILAPTMISLLSILVD